MSDIFGVRKMRLSLAAAMLLAGSACTTAAPDVRLELMMPPEYVACSEVPQQLAETDARLRSVNRRSSSAETQFWVNRQERLIARAYVCQEN